MGIDYSITLASLWFYLTDLIKTDHAKLFYGLIPTSTFVVGLLVSPMVGRITDKDKNIRQTIFFITTLLIIGNMMYSLYFSVWIVFVGRAICGIGLALRPLVYGEVARSYSGKDLSGRFSILGIVFGIGLAVGPVTIEIFKPVDIQISSFKLNYLNLPGIFMAFIFIILQLCNYFLIYDISKENNFELGTENETKSVSNDSKIKKKIDNENNSEESENLITDDGCNLQENESSNSLSTDIKILFNSFDTTMIILFSFFNLLSVMLIDCITPLIVKETLHWDLNMVVIIFGFKAAFPLAMYSLIAVYKFSQKTLYYMAVTGVLLNGINFGALLLISYISTPHVGVYYVLWGISILCAPLTEYLEFLYLPKTLFRKIPSNISSFAESIRCGSARLGSGIAFTISPYLLDVFGIYGTVSIVISFLMFLLFLCRKDTFLEKDKK